MSETEQPQEQPEQDQEQEQSQEEPTTEEHETVQQDESAPEPYQPNHRPLQNAGFDHHAAEEARKAELAQEREEHLARTEGRGERASWR